MIRTLPTRLLLLGLTMMFLGGICDGQTPTATVRENIRSEYGQEYIVSIGDVEFRAITAAHARAIETVKNDLQHAQQLIAVQQDEIDSLKRQTALEAKLDALSTSIQRLQADQVARLLAVVQKQDDLQKEMDAVKGGLPKSSWLDSFKVRFAFSALGGAANVRELLRPSPWSPAKGSVCNP